MAWTTGTASNYRDLYDRLVTFLTTDAALVAAGQQWTVLRNTSDSSNQELIIKAPGLSAADNIYCGLRTSENAPSGYWLWDLQGFIGYNGANTFANQPGAIPGSWIPRLALWNQPIPYWFVANGRRVVVVAKVSTVYEAAYLGFVLPYATPGQYPYPLLVGGSMTGERGYLYSNTSSNHRHFTDPGETQQNNAYTACMLRAPGGDWRAYQNAYNPSSEQRYDGPRQVWPKNVRNMVEERQALDGSYVLTPLMLSDYSSAADHNLVGELDGCYHVSGFGNAAENLVTVAGVDHLVVQNVYRTAQREYWALRLA